MSMMEILKLIPRNGITCLELWELSSSRMDICDFVYSLDNLFAISYIEMSKNETICRIC